MDSNVNELSRFTQLNNLSAEKLHQLETILASILALPIARDTYAQIIDGTPTLLPNADPKTDGLAAGTISDEAVQRYDDIRMAFTAQALKIDRQLAQKYQNSPPGSREHILRLLEMTAASLHALAGKVFAAFHPDTNIKPDEPPEGPLLAFHGADHYHVDFYNLHYIAFSGYPFGLLNVVGYWAETKLLGGVLLFDRGISGLEINNAFVHPDAGNKAFRLSPQQIARFSALSEKDGTAHVSGAESLLPFTKEPDAPTENVSVREGKEPLRIYKNDYDKQQPLVDPARRSCVIMLDH